MKTDTRIRDSIHGFIRLNDEELKIIDTPVYQRLRNIRQLALANLVYPGAVHTRFEHSLGVCHVAGLMANQLKLDEENKRIVRLAGLLHDIGHGPFSHVSEEILELYASDEYRRKNENATEKIHELITAEIIRSDSDLSRIIGKDDCEKVAKLLGEGLGDQINKEIISGPLDADKQDYLLRDSYYCGVKYGLFDIDQLLREFCSGNDPATGEMFLVIKRDGIHAVEQFILAKHYISTQVYHHRVRLITDQMIIRAISIGIDLDGIDELKKLYSYDGSLGHIENYKKWTDNTIFAIITNEQYRGTLCYGMLGKLMERKLLKLVFRKNIIEFESAAKETLIEICKPRNKAKRQELETNLRQIVFSNISGKNTPACLILNVYELESIRKSSINDEGEILIESAPEKPRLFRDESLLFKSIDERFKTYIIDVYADVAYDSETDKRKLVNLLKTPIKTAIEQYSIRGEKNADS